MCDYRLSLEDMLKRPAVELRLVGAEDPEDDPQGEDDPNGNGAAGENEGKKPEGSQEDGKEGKPEYTLEQAQRKIAALEDEKARHFKARQTAEAKVTELQSEVDSLRAKGVTDEGKAELQRLKSENETLRDDLQAARLEKSFLTDNGYKWHSPAAALRLADLSDVEIDDKGNVSGLKAALERLADEHPYLLAETSQDDDKPPARRSGSQPKPKGKDDEASRQAKVAKLRQKYPGLRR